MPFIHEDDAAADAAHTRAALSLRIEWVKKLRRVLQELLDRRDTETFRNAERVLKETEEWL